MKVSPELLKEWSELKERGDNQELAKILELTEQNTSKIVTTGTGPTRHIAKIKKFFEKKKALIKSLAEEQD